jgi:hypothetical protein
MAQSFTSADQGFIAVSAGNQSAGTTMTLTNSNGDEIAETTPELDYSVVYVSTQDMTKGETYTLTAGSYSESITLTDNLYSTLSGGMKGSFGGGGPRGGMSDDAGSMQGDMNGGMHKGHGNGGKFGGHGQGERPDDVTGATQLTDGEAA